MVIYIDESGVFVPQHGKHSISCVGALTIAEERHSDFEQRFFALKHKWGYGAEEIKGGKLGERQIMEFIKLLEQLGAVFHVCPTDLGCVSESDVITHRRLQAEQLLAHLTEKHQPSMINQLHEVSGQLANLSPQLYIQFFLMDELVDCHVRDVVLYYAITCPKELGSFQWIVDAKDKHRTDYEMIWGLLLPAYLQDRWLKGQPLYQACEGDYSHFQKFYVRHEKWPDYLPKPSSIIADRPVDGIDIKRIVTESLCFRSSHDCPGLEAAHICVNAFRRAVMGNLLWPAWVGLGRLMIGMRGAAINFLFVAETSQRNLAPVPAEYARTCYEMNREART